MITIDLQRIREALPERAKVVLGKKKSTVFIDCFVNPGLSDEDFEMCKNWQREILGDSILEFFTEETGRDWRIYLKRIPMEFINASDADVNSYSGMTIIK